MTNIMAFPARDTPREGWRTEEAESGGGKQEVSVWEIWLQVSPQFL